MAFSSSFLTRGNWSDGGQGKAAIAGTYNNFNQHYLW